MIVCVRAKLILLEEKFRTANRHQQKFAIHLCQTSVQCTHSVVWTRVSCILGDRFMAVVHQFVGHTLPQTRKKISSSRAVVWCACYLHTPYSFRVKCVEGEKRRLAKLKFSCLGCKLFTFVCFVFHGRWPFEPDPSLLKKYYHPP